MCKRLLNKNTTPWTQIISILFLLLIILFLYCMKKREENKNRRYLLKVRMNLQKRIFLNVQKISSWSSVCHIFILFLGTYTSKSVNKCDIHKFIIFPNWSRLYFKMKNRKEQNVLWEWKNGDCVNFYPKL